jgi:hypothetical protein
MAQEIDTEEVALAAVVTAKESVIDALNALGTMYKARGRETKGVEESIDYEQTVLAGYRRALQNFRTAQKFARGGAK